MEKTKTKTWSDVVKGLTTEDELEIANSGKCGNNRFGSNVPFGDAESTEGQMEESAAEEAPIARHQGS